jgi:hypothetical protein
LKKVLRREEVGRDPKPNIGALVDLIDCVVSWHPRLGDEGFMGELGLHGDERFQQIVAAIQHQVRQARANPHTAIALPITHAACDPNSVYPIDVVRHAIHELLFPEGARLDVYNQQAVDDQVAAIAADLRNAAGITIPMVTVDGRNKKRRDAAYWAIVAVCLWRPHEGLPVQYDFKGTESNRTRGDNAKSRNSALPLSTATAALAGAAVELWGLAVDHTEIRTMLRRYRAYLKEQQRGPRIDDLEHPPFMIDSLDWSAQPQIRK